MTNQVFYEFIVEADLKDDAVFMEAVNRIVSDLCVPKSELATALHVSVPTITRWVNGVTTPHANMREPLRRFALRHIRKENT